ncbi:hypothetical protein ACOYW6_03530 [Parablastomonas sp. CN1-191]|uniref:hypothetical protein n=1 Tax=Parablastomonas sp. CN1-191 TaxID=3400908 RepID=UPI003BF814E2
MDADRCTSALARISAAAARMEAAVARAPHASDPDLEQRHAALKDAVAATLGDLDALIGDPA